MRKALKYKHKPGERMTPLAKGRVRFKMNIIDKVFSKDGKYELAEICSVVHPEQGKMFLVIRRKGVRTFVFHSLESCYAFLYGCGKISKMPLNMSEDETTTVFSDGNTSGGNSSDPYFKEQL